MDKKQDELLGEIRDRVLRREQELKATEDEELNIEATLQALEEITSVPRTEMEHIAAEIRRSKEEIVENQNNEIRPGIQDELPATVVEAFDQLPVVYKKEFYEEYQLHRRNAFLGYVLWMVPPPFSVHNLYSNRKLLQLLYSLSLGGFFLWWMIDFFRVPVL
ncbi:MAG: hypothetical protein GY786_10650, partial [Proteobacteria bacterium]|nr:hypothetical protein [Pseudomonadota bacterium]